jgi:hypothetical protein
MYKTVFKVWKGECINQLPVMSCAAHHLSFPEYTLMLHCTPSSKQSSNSDNCKNKTFVHFKRILFKNNFPLRENTYFAHCKMFRRAINFASKVPLSAVVVIKILWIWQQQAPLILVTPTKLMSLPRRLQFTHCENLKFHVHLLWRASIRTCSEILFISYPYSVAWVIYPKGPSRSEACVNRS